jgi:hypothetical protein
MTCSCTCAPGILAERSRLEALGAEWLGCCGDVNHTYGFHLPSCACDPGDYSLRYGRGHENWACAGDFGMGWPGSRDWLGRLVNAVRSKPFYEPVVEIIGSLDGVNVNYWCRWNGWKTEKYTGSGHDTWSHISYNRELADRDLNLLGGELMSDVAYDKTDKQRIYATNERVRALALGLATIKTVWNPTPTDEPQWVINQLIAIGEAVEEQGHQLAVVDAKLDTILQHLTGGAPTTFPIAGTVTYGVVTTP